MSLTLHAKETALVLIDLEKGIVGRDLAPYLAKGCGEPFGKVGRGCALRGRNRVVRAHVAA